MPSQFPWFEETPNIININILENTYPKNINKNVQECEETEHMTVPTMLSLNNTEDRTTVFSFDNIIDILNKKEFNMPSQWVHSQYYSDDT